MPSACFLLLLSMNKPSRGHTASGCLFLALLLACEAASCIRTLGEIRKRKYLKALSAPAACFIHSLSSFVVSVYVWETASHQSEPYGEVE